MSEKVIVKSMDFIIRSQTKTEKSIVSEREQQLPDLSEPTQSEIKESEFNFGPPFEIIQKSVIKTGLGKHAKNISFNKMAMLDESDILCLKYDKAGCMVACGLSNGCVYIYNPNTGNIDRKFECSEREAPITSLRFSPIQSLGLVIASSTDGLISQFKVSTGRKCVGVGKVRNDFTGNVLQPLA